MLPSNDAELLGERAPDHTVIADGGMICVVIPHFSLPPGFDRSEADLLLRLPPGYPDVKPDMWWFDPAVRRQDGRVIQATDVTEPHLGRTWQRWSRHLEPHQWRPGIDSIESYLALVQTELRTASRAVAA